MGRDCHHCCSPAGPAHLQQCCLSHRPAIMRCCQFRRLLPHLGSGAGVPTSQRPSGYAGAPIMMVAWSVRGAGGTIWSMARRPTPTFSLDGKSLTPVSASRSPAMHCNTYPCMHALRTMWLAHRPEVTSVYSAEAAHVQHPVTSPPSVTPSTYTKCDRSMLT